MVRLPSRDCRLLTRSELTQRGGSYPRSFFCPRRQKRVSRRRVWRLRADKKRLGPPARGWLAPSTQVRRGNATRLMIRLPKSASTADC